MRKPFASLHFIRFFTPRFKSKSGIIMITLSVSAHTYTFHTTGHNLNWITKLGMMTGYGLEKMIIVGRYGSLITSDWVD